MPPIALAAPVVLPIVAGGVTALCGLAGLRVGRAVLGAGAWAGIVALLFLWIPVHSTQELNVGPLGFGAELDLRVDAVAFAFGLMVLVPAAFLLTLQPRTWQEGAVAALGLGAAMLAVEAGGVLLSALAGGTAATLAVMQLDIEDLRAPRPSWGMLLGAWLGLSWVGAILEARAGTAIYAAIPVFALTVPVFALLSAAALTVSGLFPWRGWVPKLWSRPSLRAAGMVVATLYPLGFYLLVRAYEMGDGRYPHPLLQAGLATLGVLVSLGAAARAQAAQTRRDYLGEVIPGIGGFALMGIALGTPLGLVASLIMLVTSSVLAACLPLLPDRAGPASLLTIAAAAGLPPGLAFGALVLGLEATFEAGEFLGLIGIAAAGTWVVWMVAAARAIGLPAGRGHPANETFPHVALGLAALTLLAGPALALIQTAYAAPAQVAVMPLAAGTVAGGATSVITVSTVLPAVTLFAPLVVIGFLAFGSAGALNVRGQSLPPLFSMPGSVAIGRLRGALGRAAVPEEYRSILNVRALEAAAAGGRPLLWLATLVALTFAITR
jgi:hypothetical protein